ncbi:MAG: PQQ-binding-like beta-propeller repeat protein, partial [Planctomycetota bacterium]
MPARLLLGFALLLVSLPAAGEWTRFRGPAGTGVGDGPTIPYEWSSEKNLAWRTPLPGSGTSSPIIAGGNVYVTSYTGYGLDAEAPGDAADLVRHLVAIDRETGAEAWRFSQASGADEDPYQGFI